MILAAALVLLAGSPVAPEASERCVCPTARATHAWCSVHEVGFVGGLEITSPRLHDAVDAHGHDVDVSTFTCPSCRRAIASDGFCEEHRIGFVGGKAYFSKLTHLLGTGTVLRPADIACPVCRKHSETRGWCDRCKTGMAGWVAIRDRATFDQVVRALGVLGLANAAARRCEHCAVAMITDTQCPICKIRYRDGKPAGDGAPG